MKKYIYLLLIIAFGQLGYAQNFDTKKLDLYFKTLEQNNKFLGSVAISQNGKIIYTKSIGFADVENKIVSTDQTKYRIGSISKTFTAVLTFKAIEEGKLTLDQTIDQWFPNIKNSNKITLSNLLNHRSGIHSFTENADYNDWASEVKSEKELLDIITKDGSDFMPNEKSEYSNANYVLLTFILEKTYHKSYNELLKKYITKPLQLKNTKVFGKIDIHNHEAKSYKYFGDWVLENETHASIPLGAGAILSTPTDIVKFSDALFGGKLLKKESLETMKTIQDGYGYGLFKVPFHSKIGYGHTGGIDGFTSVFNHFDDGNISYAFTSNGTNYNNNNISIAILSAVYGLDYKIPEFTNYKPTQEEFNQYIGTYASSQIPVKITISKKHQTITAQATGQMSFPLDAIEKDLFEFEPAAIKISFNTKDQTLILHQGGGQFTFKKE